MIMRHPNFPKVTRMVLVKVNAVVMFATSITATTGMLSMLANTTHAMAHMTSQLPGFFGLYFRLKRRKVKQQHSIPLQATKE